MEIRDFGGQKDAVELELELAKEILENMKNLLDPVKVRKDLTKFISYTVICFPNISNFVQSQIEFHLRIDVNLIMKNIFIPIDPEWRYWDV